jgi:hypothetical protein
MVRLSDLPGLWRRTMIAWPDGRSDITTDVYWLQGSSHYADLRIPRGRPALGRTTCLMDLDWSMLRFMARQEGFIGHLEVCDGVAHWHRAFDYQPQTGFADKGRLGFENDILVEHGLETAYVEHWQREPQTTQEVAMLWLAADGSHAVGCLIVASGVFMYARGRAAPLPPHTTLSRLLDDAASLDEAQVLFDCEISFGRRDGIGWTIERSSLPFREGQTLWPHVTGDALRLSVNDLTPQGAATKRSWRITGWEGAGQTSPFDHFLSRRSKAAPELQDRQKSEDLR